MHRALHKNHIAVRRAEVFGVEHTKSTHVWDNFCVHFPRISCVYCSFSGPHDVALLNLIISLSSCAPTNLVWPCEVRLINEAFTLSVNSGDSHFAHFSASLKSKFVFSFAKNLGANFFKTMSVALETGLWLRLNCNFKASRWNNIEVVSNFIDWVIMSTHFAGLVSFRNLHFTCIVPHFIPSLSIAAEKIEFLIISVTLWCSLHFSTCRICVSAHF